MKRYNVNLNVDYIKFNSKGLEDRYVTDTKTIGMFEKEEEAINFVNNYNFENKLEKNGSNKWYGEWLEVIDQLEDDNSIYNRYAYDMNEYECYIEDEDEDLER